MLHLFISHVAYFERSDQCDPPRPRSIPTQQWATVSGHLPHFIQDPSHPLTFAANPLLTPMKKMIGLALWLLALAIPFRFAILDSTDLVQPDGTVENIKGLMSFVATLVLFFVGYALVDSAKKQGSEEAGGH